MRHEELGKGVLVALSSERDFGGGGRLLIYGLKQAEFLGAEI